MLKLLERIIREKTPYHITTSNNSLEVPNLLKQKSYDLIIADLKMPRLDGLDILRMLKEQDRFEEVIMITAFGSIETAIEALSLGVFDYITKPFKKEQIIFAINRVMRWQGLKREAAYMNSIFRLEPYERAQKAWEREYVRRLVERKRGDQKEATKSSGIPLDRINLLMKDELPNDGRAADFSGKIGGDREKGPHYETRADGDLEIPNMSNGEPIQIIGACALEGR